MVSEGDRLKIISIAERYKVKRLYLFGSSAADVPTGRDIDLAVEGIRDEDFFKFFGDLIFGLDKPVDLVDLSKDSKFTRLIRQEGFPLYG